MQSATATAFDNSSVSRTVAWGESVVRSSWLYRWLTTEPESEVIVIDLRDTWTVGPILGALDRVVETLAPEWRSAKLHGLTDQLIKNLETRPVQVVSVVALVAIVTNLVLQFTLGSLDQTRLGFGLLGLSIALAGTRSKISWAEIEDSQTYKLLRAILEPPDTPDESERR